MKQISIQFFALPNEILDWVKGWQAQFELCVAYNKFWPDFQTEEIFLTKGSRWFENGLGIPDEVWLSLEKMDLISSRNHLDLMGRNPNRLTITMPRLTNDGMREAALGAETEDRNSLKVWRTIKGAIKDRTAQGMWVRNPKTGIKGYVERLRYTNGAASFAEGVHKLLAIAGTNEMYIHEPVS